MKLSEAIKPISYVKAHMSEIISEMAEVPKTVIITQNGEAKAILQDIHSYEKMQETIALVKMLNMSKESIEAGRTKPAGQLFDELTARLKSVS